MRMVDEEGTISTADVSAKFVNGLPVTLTVTYMMQSSQAWDRFMRFMDRYAASNDLGFAGGSSSNQSPSGKPRSQGV